MTLFTPRLDGSFLPIECISYFEDTINSIQTASLNDKKCAPQGAHQTDEAVLQPFFDLVRRWAFDMPAESFTHGGKHLLGKGVFLPRAEPGVERGGENICRNTFLQSRLDRPPSFAGVFHEAAVFFEFRAGDKRDCTEVEQPGGNHAAPPPKFGDFRQVQIVAQARFEFLVVGPPA